MELAVTTTADAAIATADATAPTTATDLTAGALMAPLNTCTPRRPQRPDDAGCGRRGRGLQGQPSREELELLLSEQRRGWPAGAWRLGCATRIPTSTRVLRGFGPMATAVSTTSTPSFALQVSSAISCPRALACSRTCSHACCARCLAGCRMTQTTTAPDYSIHKLAFATWAGVAGPHWKKSTEGDGRPLIC